MLTLGTDMGSLRLRVTGGDNLLSHPQGADAGELGGGERLQPFGRILDRQGFSVMGPRQSLDPIRWRVGT